MLTLSNSSTLHSSVSTVVHPEMLSLRDTVQYVVERHLADSEGEVLKHNVLYETVQYEMEKGLFEAILKFTGGNESRASRILGISRGTLRQRRELFGDYAKNKGNQEQDA